MDNYNLVKKLIKETKVKNMRELMSICKINKLCEIEFLEMVDIWEKHTKEQEKPTIVWTGKVCITPAPMPYMCNFEDLKDTIK